MLGMAQVFLESHLWMQFDVDIEARMTKVWTIGEGETVCDCVAPTDDPWQIQVCVECSQIAYRVVIVAKSDSAKRLIPLCGRHFISACLRIPELSKYKRGGKLG